MPLGLGPGSLPMPPMLPATTGGSIQSVGNPDLSALAGRGMGAGAGQRGDVLRVLFEAESAIDSLIAATSQSDSGLGEEDDDDLDTSSIAGELSDIKARLRDLVIRATSKRTPSEDMGGAVGPSGEGRTRF